MQISFIIPAYNASVTIVRCLNSIYALPIEESCFETIVIDDCSTDNTVELVKEYETNHSNLVLLCQLENHKQGAARNRGIAIAKGKYIVFVDSDDETMNGVLSAIQLAEESHLEMVVMRCAKVDGNGIVKSEMDMPFERDKVFSGVEMQSMFPFWGTAPWPYVYRKEFLDEVGYPFVEDVLFEDTDFVCLHLFYAKKISYSDNCGYRMHYNAGSTTHTFSSKSFCDYALLGTRMLRFYESLEDKTSKYAKGILEGGSYNIMKAFRKLPLLKSRSNVCAFYDRFDAFYDRKQLRGYREPAYCWTKWTRFCLKHRLFATWIVTLIIPVIKMTNKKKYVNSNRIQSY